VVINEHFWPIVWEYGTNIGIDSSPNQVKNLGARPPTPKYSPRNSDIPCYYRHRTAERTALHTVQYNDVYIVEVCYMDDCMEVSCTADDMVVHIADACRTRDKAASRRHMDYCNACCTVCVHNATGSGLYMVDMTRHTSPASVSIAVKQHIISRLKEKNIIIIIIIIIIVLV